MLFEYSFVFRHTQRNALDLQLLQMKSDSINLSSKYFIIKKSYTILISLWIIHWHYTIPEIWNRKTHRISGPITIYIFLSYLLLINVNSIRIRYCNRLRRNTFDRYTLELILRTTAAPIQSTHLWDHYYTHSFDRYNIYLRSCFSSQIRIQIANQNRL